MPRSSARLSRRIRAANGLKTDSIKVGQKLTIPAKRFAPAAAPVAPAEPVPTAPRLPANRAARAIEFHPVPGWSWSGVLAYISVQMKVAVTILISCVAALLALGMVILYSSSMAQVGAHYLVTQLVWCGLGSPCACGGRSLDYRRLKKFAWPLFALALVLLALIFLPPVGIRRGTGPRAGWVIQMTSYSSRQSLPSWPWSLCWHGIANISSARCPYGSGDLFPGLMIGVTVGLIFMEPDVGNALGVGHGGGILLLISGIRLRIYCPGLVAALGVGAFIYYNPMRSGRIDSWLHVEETRRNNGLQAYEAMVALGSGGLTGKGLGGRPSETGIPAGAPHGLHLLDHGEELGLIATLLVVWRSPRLSSPASTSR